MRKINDYVYRRENTVQRKFINTTQLYILNIHQLINIIYNHSIQKNVI